MSRTYKDLPYKVARERFGERDPFLVSARPARRDHVADVIFYAHEVERIAVFEKHLAADARFEFSTSHEVVGHLTTLVTGARDYHWRLPTRVNGELLGDLADLKRVCVGGRPASDFFTSYEISHKTNVFKVYPLIRVNKGRPAYLDDEKSIPYWGRYFPSCDCEWCLGENRGALGKRAERQLRELTADFNTGVDAGELDDDLL